MGKNCDASPQEANIYSEEAKKESKVVDGADAGAVDAKSELEDANAIAKLVDGAEPESGAHDRTIGVDTTSADPEGASNNAIIVDGAGDEKEIDVEKNVTCELLCCRC